MSYFKGTTKFISSVGCGLKNLDRGNTNMYEGPDIYVVLFIISDEQTK